MNWRWSSSLGLPSALTATAMLGACSAGGGNSTPSPTATLSASPSTTGAGERVILTFTSTNADQGSIDNGLGGVGLNGTAPVMPTATTTYTFTATGSGGSATAQATVTIAPPTATLTASPSVIFPGETTTLTFSSTNSTTGNINNQFAGTAGTLQQTPNATTTFTYTAGPPDGPPATATATVTVFPGTSFSGITQAVSNNPTETDIDANGAVGRTQFMEYVNSQYDAVDKLTLAPVWRAPVAIGTPWQQASIAQCTGSNITLDGVINYDRLASVWVIAAKASDSQGNYYLCIAVSNQDDLTTATWNAYVFNLSASGFISNPKGGFYLPDWPKLGTWPDAYYVTMDLIDEALVNGSPANTEAGVLACAFDRSDMLQGNPMLTPQCFPGPSVLLSSGIYLGHSLIPADLDGTTPPPSGRDEFMISIQNPTNDGKTTTSNSLNLWDFHLDWTTPSNSTFVQSLIRVPSYTPGCYDPALPGQTNCVPEPTPSGSTTSQFIDSVGDRLMPRFPYRNFGSYESFLASHTVQTSTSSQTGIRWYELRATGAGTPSIHQSGTLNPDTSLFRFLPSIAEDKDHNAAVGYSVSNGSTDPGINFSYWSLDTPNATATEVVIIDNSNGEEVTGTGFGQWGTYSSMTVDPSDDCTFWYVNELWLLPPLSSSSSWSTNISYFQLPNCQ